MMRPVLTEMLWDAAVVLRCETVHIPQHRGQHNAQESAHREREKH